MKSNTKGLLAKSYEQEWTLRAICGIENENIGIRILIAIQRAEMNLLTLQALRLVTKQGWPKNIKYIYFIL